MVKLGFTGVYIIFLISAQNIDCGYSLEPPRRGKISIFLSENFHFLVVKKSVYLNRHVFVMRTKKSKEASSLFPNKVIAMLQSFRHHSEKRFLLGVYFK